MSIRLFILIFPLSLFSQHRIDSLNRLYETSKNKNLKNAYEYAQEAINLNEEVKNDSLKLVSYNNYIEVLYRQGNDNEVEKFVVKLKDLAYKNNSKKYICLSHLYFSNIKRKKRNYDKSLVDIEKALALSRNTDFYEIEHKVLNSKALLLKATSNNEKALILLKNVLKNNNFKDPNDLSYTYNSLANIYFDFLKKKDSSVYLYKKGIDIIKKTDNEYLKTLLYINLGDVLLQTDNKQKGVDYLKLAEVSAKKSHNYRFLYTILSSLGIYYHKNEDYAEAIEKYKEAEEEYGKYTSKESIAHIYWMLSEALYLNNQPKEAYLCQEKLLNLRDSLFTIEKNKTFEKLQTEYEVENKNNQIQLLKKQKELEANRKKAILGIGGLLLLVLGLLVFNYRSKVRSGKLIREKEQKLHQQEKEQLEQTQKLQRIEGFVQGEEKEKNRIAIELHDGIGGKLAGVKHLVSALQATNDTMLLAENITDITKEVRLLSHSLSYTYSLQKPLKHLLEELEEQYKNHFNVEVILYPENEITAIKDDKKLFIYRCIQELVNNCYKYAKANNLSISLNVTDEILLMVEDDGVGFNIANISTGIGLQNIKEKLVMFHGDLHIDTVVNRGTTIIVKLPK